MLVPIEVLIDGVVRTLIESVLPDVGGRFARGQLYAAVDVLRNLRDRVDAKVALDEAEASSAAVALERAIASLPPDAAAPLRVALDHAAAAPPAEPIASTSTGDRNYYDRHFFNGFTRDGDLYFGAALGLYPTRRVMDAAFTVIRDGRQQSVRASRLAPDERGETRVGPIAIEVV